MKSQNTVDKLELLLDVIKDFCKDNNIEYVAEFQLGENQYYYSKSSRNALLNMTTAIEHYQRNLTKVEMF